MKSQLFVLITSLMCRICHCYVLQDILWDPRNILFDSGTCAARSRKFYAKIGDELNFLCANPQINIGLNYRYPVYKWQMFYNIYYTDTESVYRARNGTAALLIHTCKVTEHEVGKGMFRPAVYKKNIFLSRFEMFGISFEEEKKYWFFTTSDGTEASLTNKIGDKDSMGFQLEICSDKSKCDERNRTEICLPKTESFKNEEEISMDLNTIALASPKMIQPNNPPIKSNQHQPTPTSAPQQSTSTPETSIWIASIVLALILGILVGVLLMIVRKKCKREENLLPASARRHNTVHNMKFAQKSEDEDLIKKMAVAV